MKTMKPTHIGTVKRCSPGAADVIAATPELIDTARRLRHDAETLLLLAGIDADVRPGSPMRLSALLDEAVAFAEAGLAAPTDYAQERPCTA